MHRLVLQQLRFLQLCSSSHIGYFMLPQSLNDTEKVKQCVAAAERGLSDLQAYSGAQRSQFDIFLKGNM